MVEVSDRGIKEEEIELDLGLSIGGASCRRLEKPKLSLGETTVVLRSNSSAVSTATLSEAENMVVDPQVKREIQALRRQEAKRKREKKKKRAQTGEPPAKKNGVHVNLNISNGGQAEGHHYPVGPVQYPYAPVQFVPYSNGFAYSCVVPCWASNGSGFRPFQVNQYLVNSGEQNGKTASSLNDGSPICSSSTISENYSAASHEGGSSDNKRSHSSRLDGSGGKNIKGQSDHTATSHSAEPNHNLVQPKEEPAQGNTEPLPISKPKPISPKEECPPAPLKEVKMEPPKLKTENTKTTQKTPSLPQMPYVSTTGNGTNGKTVHGFLYNYSKSEISIVCVCHGSTFSPAEFVQHAGSTEVLQPLRHITVISSAFG